MKVSYWYATVRTGTVLVRYGTFRCKFLASLYGTVLGTGTVTSVLFSDIQLLWDSITVMFSFSFSFGSKEKFTLSTIIPYSTGTVRVRYDASKQICEIEDKKILKKIIKNIFLKFFVQLSVGNVNVISSGISNVRTYVCKFNCQHIRIRLSCL